MLCTKAKNAIMHRIINFNTTSFRSPQGRHQKLTTAYLLDRIFFVLKSGCQWSMLPVPGSSYKTVYHYFNKWSKASIFEKSFYDVVRSKEPQNSLLIADTSFVKNVMGRDVLGARLIEEERLQRYLCLRMNIRHALYFTRQIKMMDKLYVTF